MLDVSTKVCWTDRLGLTTTVLNEINTVISVNRTGNTFSSMCSKFKIIFKKHQCYSTVYLVNIYMENTTKTNIRGSRQDCLDNIQYAWETQCGDCTSYIQHNFVHYAAQYRW
jgi:hypothetical protein